MTPPDQEHTPACKTQTMGLRAPRCMPALLSEGPQQRGPAWPRPGPPRSGAPALLQCGRPREPRRPRAQCDRSRAFRGRAGLTGERSMVAIQAATGLAYVKKRRTKCDHIHTSRRAKRSAGQSGKEGPPVTSCRPLPLPLTPTWRTSDFLTTARLISVSPRAAPMADP